MDYPRGYEWLGTVGTLPKIVTEMLKIHGTREIPGAVNSPVIMGWAKETGLEKDGYSADSVPWCGLAAAVVVQRAGYDFPKHPLWALNWLNFGSKVQQPILGSILVFSRTGGNHVTLYLGEDTTHYHCLGGNQSDMVNVVRIEKKRLRGAREPVYARGRPASAKPYIVSPIGAISTNEA